MISGIGPPYDGKAGYFLEGFFVVVALGKFLHHFVQEVAGSVSVHCDTGYGSPRPRE